MLKSNTISKSNKYYLKYFILIHLIIIAMTTISSRVPAFENVQKVFMTENTVSVSAVCHRLYLRECNVMLR